MERTCHRCSRPTWVVWETRAWCRDDFLAEQAARAGGVVASSAGGGAADGRDPM